MSPCSSDEMSVLNAARRALFRIVFAENPAPTGMKRPFFRHSVNFCPEFFTALRDTAKFDKCSPKQTKLDRYIGGAELDAGARL